MTEKRKSILIICAGLPYPPNDGVRTRVYNVARQLQRQFEITIISIVKDTVEMQLVDEAQEHLGDSIIPVFVQRTLLRKMSSMMFTLFSNSPFERQFYYFREVADVIRAQIRGKTFDYVQFERSFLCFYLPVIPAYLTKTINLYDFETLRHERIGAMSKGIRKLFATANQRRIRKYEKDVFNNVDMIFAISNSEKKDVEREFSIAPDKVDIVTGGIDTESYPYIDGLPTDNSIMFVGSGMNFNYDAIHYFYKDVFPLIRRRISDVKWHIIGKLDPMELSYLENDPSVVFTPNVPSVIPFYKKTKILVVPLRGGSGTRIKIFESMALGRSIVTTSIGCEGIDVANGQNILIEDTPEGFSDAVCALLMDTEKNNTIRSNAYRFIKEKYDWREVCKPLSEYYEDEKI